MRKATIEQMDNGYLLILESDKLEKPERWVDHKLKKIFNQLALFFMDGKSVLKDPK